MQAKGQEKYRDTATLETIVAFDTGEKTLSGKIKEIQQEAFTVECKNGVRFKIAKESVLWYKTGQRWPNWVYSKLKGE